jgi:Holliday junction resolvasome RuvABC endonuclease subunit
MRVLGIDPSLTATGLALIDLDTHAVVDTWTIASKGKADATLRQRLARIDSITHDATVLDQVALVVIEGPSLGQTRQSGTFDRAGLWWAIVGKFAEYDIPVVEVAPACRARYATGKGNAGKDTVLLEVARRYPTVPVANNNEADALVLAAMGCHHLTGHGLVDLPQAHTAALAAVTWPASTGRAA